eukprot:15461778-Alexandrium_andersonii.AAC.1
MHGGCTTAVTHAASFCAADEASRSNVTHACSAATEPCRGLQRVREGASGWCTAVFNGRYAC